MDIRLLEITVGDLANDYRDDGEGGVTGYGGKLDIRPPFQREFVYKDKQREAVIDTVFNGYPLNVMYWADCADDRFEIIDGQQRTISICQFVEGDFSVNLGNFNAPRAFHNLQDDEQRRILESRLMVYACSGTDSEKLEWFRTVNIAGEKLTDQELRNAVYSGSWVTDAKRYFSRRGCPAQKIAQDYLKGSANRQEYLETAIKWINDGDITGYMSGHQHDPTAFSLWDHFQSVINWVRATFTKKRRKFMQGVDWGSLYRDHGNRSDLDPVTIETETERLVADEDVEKKSGIYPYILTRDEKHLNIRAFSPAIKQKEPGSDRAVYAVNAGKGSMIYQKWKPTTSPPGARAEKQTKKTARYSARTATAGNPTNKPSNFMTINYSVYRGW